jgi:integrase
MSVSVRYWRGVWVVDVSTKTGGTRKPLSPRTVAKILTLVGTIFRYGKTIKLVKDNPAGDVKKPRAVKRAVYEWSVEDIARLRHSFDVFEEQLMVELDITTGLRSGELRGLAWPMVDLKSKRIHVVSQATRRRADDPTKTPNSIRTVPTPVAAWYFRGRQMSWESVVPSTPTSCCETSCAALCARQVFRRSASTTCAIWQVP